MPPGTVTLLLKAVLTASWQGTLVLLLVLALRPLLGSRVSARWRYLLWAFVLVRLLVPSFILPPSPASLQNIPIVDRPGERLDAALDEAYPDHFVAGESGAQKASPEKSAADVEFPPARIPTRAFPHGDGSFWQFGAIIWAAGATLLAAWMLGATVRLHRRMRGEDAPLDEAIAAIWAASCARFSLRRPPRLLVVRWIGSPALVGVFRPTLLIPERSIESFSREDWEHILMHELAHYRRRDHWTHALQLVALCVHWFNPLVWVGFRFLRADRELAADELALQRLTGERAIAYGDTLLKVLSAHSAAGFQPGMIGIMDDSAQLKQRLRRIVSFGPSQTIGSMLGLGLILVLSVVVLGRASNNADPSSSGDIKPEGKSDNTPAAAKGLAVYVTSIPGERGQILDRNGKALVTNRQIDNLAIQFPKMSMTDAEVLEFADQQTLAAQSILHQRGELHYTITRILRHYKDCWFLPYDIVEDLTEEEKADLKKAAVPGLSIRSVALRHYPNGTLGAHFLGFAYLPNQPEPIQTFPKDPGITPKPEPPAGRDGLELAFNDQLAGKPGSRNTMLDVKSRKISEKVISAPLPGRNVVTTIDTTIQSLCEKALEEGGRPGAIVIIDPNNGDVLAMATWPTFDPNEFLPSISQARWKALSEDPRVPLLNRGYRAAYPPGSTFKVFAGLAALESGAIKLDDKLPNPPSIQLGDHKFLDWKNSDRGMLSFADALEQNADTWFYQAGIKTGAKPIIDWALKLGFSKKTGLPLDGESAGAIPTEEFIKQRLNKNWEELSSEYTANLAIGQGYTLVTPVQMAQAMATLANGGTFHQTRLVKQLQNHDGKVVGEYNLPPRGHIDIRPEILAELKKAMIAAVSGNQGSGHDAAIEGIQVAGSAGSAQWSTATKKRVVGWFTGFAPAERPKYAFAAVYEADPEQGIPSGADAARMVGKVLRACETSRF